MAQLDIGIIFTYLLMLIGIGLYAGRRQKTASDFYVAGGRLGTFSIACLWLASWVGGAAIVGGAARAYDFGVSAAWYIGAMAIGCLLFGLFFARRVKQLGDKHQLLTYPDLIEVRYDSRTRIIATITTAAAFTAYAAGQLAAAAAILHTLLGWDVGASLLLASAVIVLYTATGGFLAVTYTDWLQFALLFIGIVLIGIPIAISNGGTWPVFTANLPAEHFVINNRGWGAIAAMVLAIVLSFFTAMDSYTRCFAAKNKSVARRGTLLAVVFFVPLAIGAVWLGLTSAVLFPDISNSADVLSTFIVEKFPVGLKGLVLVGVLAALMSTADICILTASANVSRDVYQRYVNPDIGAKALFRLSIAISVIVGIVATLLAWRMHDVVNILIVGFTINSAALFIPSVLMVLGKKTSANAAFWSITLSLATVLIWMAVSKLPPQPEFPLLQIMSSIDPLWPGLAVSALILALMNIVARQNS